jgi:leucyl-tRNA synthetase
LRLYEMAMGPLDASRPWESRDVVGMFRFLQRVWRNVVDEDTGKVRDDLPNSDDETERLVHRTIDGVRSDMDGLRFNTAIAKLIELNNHLTKLGGCPAPVAERLVLMLAPLAPHVAEELWRLLGHDTSLTYADFPTAEPEMLVEDTIEVPVQVNGKVRARIMVAADADAATVESIALAEPKVVSALGGNAPKRVIVIPGKMVNVVA